jgi:5'-phosphate synthase pdxT subunit
MSVGVLAVQGDFEKHLTALAECGVGAVSVRTVEELVGIERLIIPGGESSTTGLLLERYGLGSAIRERAGEDLAIWGTCMGMILMAAEVENRDQYRLGVLDITVRRNAFGAQVHSFEAEVAVEGLSEPVLGVFIRAPIVTRLGPGVEAIGRYAGEVVAVRTGRLLGTSFHPELTPDRRLHELFLKL